MKIDGHEKEKNAMKAFGRGDQVEGHRLQDEFVSEVRESLKSEDHCPCTAKCKFHGKCLECVAIHRAHRQHLPYCFRDMVNEKIAAVSELTEHSLMSDVQK